jgi:penicillin-binding protein 1A
VGAFFTWNGLKVDTLTVLDSAMRSIVLLQAGLVALNPQDGSVLTYVGGLDFQSQAYDQILARRPMASTFKPILYAAAIENGKAPCDYLSNKKLVLKDYNNWRPLNYEPEDVGGKYSLAAALTYSKNIPTVRLWLETDYDEVNYLWKKMGFEAILENKPANALGAANANLLELSRAYAVFGNGGYALKSHRVDLILSPEGDTIYQYQPDSIQEQVLRPRTVDYMNFMLQRVINDGTGRAIRSRYHVGLPLAGKTGTATQYKDAWFVAYNPEIVVATRVGANRPKIHFSTGTYGSGSSLALPLVALYLAQAEQHPQSKDLVDAPFPPMAPELRDSVSCNDYKKFLFGNNRGIFGSAKAPRAKETKKSKRKAKREKRKNKRKKRSD